MAQDVIETLLTLCEQLKDKLMQQPEYRALLSLEKTIQDISECMGSLEQSAPPPRAYEPPAPESRFDASAMSMRQGAGKVADVLADALMERKQQIARSTADHLPSHRVA
ncbi:MAG: hypothetical protein JWM36_3767 [Hyphomicrobiales bacterium]|nr:hypothetical protein [Hyphomicrobiales bacterium]